jgi:alkaline phosphatase D
MSVWTRVHGVGGAGRVRYEIARDPGFSRVVEAGTVRTSRHRDFVARADVGGLRPGERYWYRFHTRGADSPVGRFVTRRPPDSREPVRIAVYSCQDYESGHYAAHRALAAEDVELVVMVGDYIYERAAPGGVREDRTGAHRDGDAQTLREYRAKYRLYRSDPDLQAMHAAHPHIAFWDSHDVEPLGDDKETTDQYGAKRRVPHSARLRNGMRAFLEYMPQRPHFGRPHRLYRSLRLGAAAELILTDEQLYHDPYPCAFGFPPEECPAAYDPSRTYLGAAQKAWLKRTLAASPATWKLYCGGTMMMGFELSRGRAFNTGQWDGFRAERAELMQFLLDRRIGNVVRLSGDIHTFFAGQVTTTGDSDGSPAAVEFIGGSISSLGIPEGFSAQTGLPPEAIAPVTEQARETNRHIAYTDMRHRGYKVVEARPDGLTVTFRAPVDATRRDSEVIDLQRFAVPLGRPEVELT